MTTAVMAGKKPLGITIPEADGEERRRHQEEWALKQAEHPSDLREKRAVGEKKKKKKRKGLVVWTLMTSSRTRIPIPLTEEEEKL